MYCFPEGNTRVHGLEVPVEHWSEIGPRVSPDLLAHLRIPALDRVDPVLA